MLPRCLNTRSKIEEDVSEYVVCDYDRASRTIHDGPTQSSVSFYLTGVVTWAETKK